MSVVARADDLAAHLTRRLPALHGAQAESGRRLAERLCLAGDEVAEGCSLIIGGSLSRGEPSLNSASTPESHFSDLDLLLVHEGRRPPEPTDDVLGRIRRHLPDADLMVLPADVYPRLPTSLGYDFKENGFCINGPLPAFEPTVVTRRDAFEICIYAQFIWLWTALARREAAGLGTTMEVTYGHSRVVLKLLRTAAMLHGGIGHHDAGGSPPWLAALLRDEAAFHDDPSVAARPSPVRFVAVVRRVLAHHAELQGGERTDAVAGTRYEGLGGTAYVAQVQAVALATVRGLLARVGDGTTPGELADALVDAWDQVVHDHAIARPTHGPEEWFLLRRAAIQDALLEMKLRWARSGRAAPTDDRRGGGGIPWD